MMGAMRNFPRRLAPATATLCAAITAVGALSTGALAGTDPPTPPWPADTPGTTHVTFDFSDFAQPSDAPNTRTGTQTWGDNVNPRGAGDPTVQFYPDEWGRKWDDYRKDWYWMPKDRPGE